MTREGNAIMSTDPCRSRRPRGLPSIAIAAALGLLPACARSAGRDRAALPAAEAPPHAERALLAETEADSLQQAMANEEGVAVSSRGGDIVVTLASDHLFDPGSPALRATALGTLDAVVSAIRERYHGSTFQVVAHTYLQPHPHIDARSLERLSAARANAVKESLVGRGFHGDEVTTGTSVAPRHPFAGGLGRRVEIVIRGIP
jgi:outer membrane protein OmpA-like peptidoglycan-associated protein